MVAEPLRITIVTPAARGSRVGNRVTALRWAALLRGLGHRPRIAPGWRDVPCDLLISVHAVKSANAVRAARTARPGLPIATLLSGTDIYPTFAPDASTSAAIEAADALIALQPLARDALPAHLRARVRTVVQSATPGTARSVRERQVCVLAHLRPVKAPLLAVRAVRSLPADAPVELVLAGGELDPDYSALVRREVALEPRISYVGELGRTEAKRLIAGSAACLVPSLAEGGANVISEAVAAGTPVLCSAVPGNLGLLGSDWPGAFEPGDVEGCARMLLRTVTEPAFVDDLRARTVLMQPMVAPAAEREAWRRLLAELCGR